MTTFERSPQGRTSDGVQWAAAAVCALALALTLIPSTITGRLKTWQQTLLVPGQRAAASLVDWYRQSSSLLTAGTPTSEGSPSQREEIETLRRRNAQLQTALAVANTRAEDAQRSAHDSATPLLVPKLLPARVLGRQARAFLSQLHTITAGADDGVLPAAFVLDDALPLVDQGSGAGIDAGQLVITGATVWGQISTLGGHVSTVRPATASGYRDLVQLARTSADRMIAGPQGVLEGTGERLCRIKLIQTTESVSEGDVVLATGGEALVDAPLVYGRVVRVENRPGEPHWDIWMEPAARSQPREVAVLQISLSEARLAAGSRPIERLVQSNSEREQP
jgi:cell shape-determining protein MreC